MTTFHYLDLPDDLGVVGIVALELPGQMWIRPDLATTAEWAEAGRLSASRLGRCRRGSQTWWRHRAVIYEAEKRCNARLMVVRR